MAKPVTVWVVTCSGCGELLDIGARRVDPEEIDVSSKPCNIGFTGLRPHCTVAGRMPFMFAVRTNVEVKSRV